MQHGSTSRFPTRCLRGENIRGINLFYALIEQLTRITLPASVVALLAIAVSACTSVRQYEGPVRSASEIAVLTKRKGSGAVINDIDGKFRGIGDLDRHEFLPGSHTLLIHFMSAATGTMRYSPEPQRLTFDAKPGGTYILITRTDPGERQWTAWIEDTSTNQVVSKTER